MDMVNINIYKKLNKNGVEETEYRYNFGYDKDKHIRYYYNGKSYLFHHDKTFALPYDCNMSNKASVESALKEVPSIEVYEEDKSNGTMGFFNSSVRFRCKECGKTFEHMYDKESIPMLTSVYDNEKTIVLDTIYLRYGIIKHEVRKTAIKRRIVFNKENFSIYLIKKHLKDNGGEEFEFYKKDFKRTMDYKAGNYYAHRFNGISPYLIKKRYELKDNFAAMFLYRLRDSNSIKTYNDFRGMGIKEISKKLHISKSYIMSTLISEKDNIDRDTLSMRGNISAIATFSDLLDANNVSRILNLKDKYINFDSHGIAITKGFVKKYIKANSEKKIVNYLILDNGNYLSDSARMYSDLRKDKKFKELINLKGSVKEVHDKLSKLHEKIEIESENIKYLKETEKKFKDMEFEGIKYRLAKDTMELVRVGQKMGICVGSYANEALGGKCIILLGYKDEEPVTCIELRRIDKKYHVYQVKGKYNYKKDLAERSYLIDTFKDKEADVDTYDLTDYDTMNQVEGVFEDMPMPIQAEEQFYEELGEAAF